MKHSFQVGDEIITIKDHYRTLWPRAGEDNNLPSGTQAVVSRIPKNSSDVVCIRIDKEDTWGDNDIYINIKYLQKL